MVVHTCGLALHTSALGQTFGEFGVGARNQVRTRKEYSPAGWSVQSSEDGQERGLARARGSGHHDPTALLNTKVHVIQRADFERFADMIELAQRLNFKKNHSH